jgi:hypothetical protein
VNTVPLRIKILDGGHYEKENELGETKQKQFEAG